jgi:hypothetical protein
MEKVLGIGGFFFRAKEPNVLARWYAEPGRVEQAEVFSDCAVSILRP